MNQGAFEFGEGGSMRGGNIDRPNDAGARWNVPLMRGNISARCGGLICW
jgi:hypothetical protein